LGHPVEKPETIATAIRIGKPARGEQALEAAEQSGGRIIAVSDDEIMDMHRRLASEGVWVEPASAAGLAGLAAQVRDGVLELNGLRVVAVCTGHGLKDPDAVTRRMSMPAAVVPELSNLEDIILRP
jgi:threonine synthase